MDDAVAVWVGPGGIVAAVILVITGVWGIRHQRENNKNEAKRVATEASAAAVKSLSVALEQQERRLTNSDTQIADMSSRLTENERVRLVAVEHIADRETFAISYWEKRPKGLPKIPELIHSEVLATAPHLRIAQMEHGGDGPDDNDDDDEDEEDSVDE